MGSSDSIVEIATLLVDVVTPALLETEEALEENAEKLAKVVALVKRFDEHPQRAPRKNFPPTPPHSGSNYRVASSTSHASPILESTRRMTSRLSSGTMPSSVGRNQVDCGAPPTTGWLPSQPRIEPAHVATNQVITT